LDKTDKKAMHPIKEDPKMKLDAFQIHTKYQEPCNELGDLKVNR
jgi:hypothetical protein